MNVHSTSTQVLSGTFKRGAGRIILLALGGTVVAAAVVTAVAVRQSSESNSPSDVSAQMNSSLYPASRDGVRGHVGIDASLVAASESARSTSRPTNYPASRQAERTVRTTYIVASPEQAAAVWTGLANANAIRLAVGEPLLLDSVLVVGSDAEAEAARAVINDVNRALVALSEQEEIVVDLRRK